MKTYLILFICFAILPVLGAQGRIVVSHDVNTLASQYAGGQEQQFAVNVATFLTENSNDSLLIIESTPNGISRNFAQEIRDALHDADFVVTYSNSVDYTLNQLQKYGAVFT